MSEKKGILVLVVVTYLIVLSTLIKMDSHSKHEVMPDDRDGRLWTKGRIVYRVNCTSCHNTNPDLPGSVGPILRGVSESLLKDRLKNGKGGMPALPNLEKYARALREYLR